MDLRQICYYINSLVSLTLFACLPLVSAPGPPDAQASIFAFKFLTDFLTVYNLYIAATCSGTFAICTLREAKHAAWGSWMLLS